MKGTEATDSTLLTMVGLPRKPDTAGKGGLMLGWPLVPVTELISPVSSPQM